MMVTITSLQLYLRETIEHGPLPGQHCYKFAITKADKGTTHLLGFGNKIIIA